MADQRTQQQNQQYQQQQQEHRSDEGPSASQIVAVLTLLPVGATLVFLAGLTLTGTVLGLAVSTPLFVVFSPVLVPAALVIGLAVTGFLTSGAFGITAVSALTWLANHLRERVRGGDGAGLTAQAKRRMQETAGYLGQKTKEAGQTIQTTAQQQEASGRSQETGRPQEGTKTRTG
ncbi:oleosin H2 [Ziziphus jujuba]|uniref:Oleosin n=2 Tax=Ziziphus jujuba TaxID=326968 RepID=A0A6P4AA67_ZIZJJ|nr:oleosin H2 [Ziziphus jujuba]KAH7528418.1 hypothetical protein FEM48_Zijuj05G0070100 [Ziziphus jujuba var. spinosa]